MWQLKTDSDNKRMKLIPLTQGQSAMIDDEDYESISQFKWYAVKGKHTFYAARNIIIGNCQVRIWMHRQILGELKEEIFSDHSDRNGLNNQRSNLRKATRAQNKANGQSHKNSSSKYLGVHWDSQRNKWKALVVSNGVKKFMGRFDSEEDAALAYNNGAAKIHGEFANLNIVSCGN